MFDIEHSARLGNAPALAVTRASAAAAKCDMLMAAPGKLVEQRGGDDVLSDAALPPICGWWALGQGAGAFLVPGKVLSGPRRPWCSCGSVFLARVYPDAVAKYLRDMVGVILDAGAEVEGPAVDRQSDPLRHARQPQEGVGGGEAAIAGGLSEEGVLQLECRRVAGRLLLLPSILGLPLRSGAGLPVVLTLGQLGPGLLEEALVRLVGRRS